MKKVFLQIVVAAIFLVSVFAFPNVANAAISFIDSESNDSSSNNEVTVSVPSGTVDADVMIASCGKDDNEGGASWVVSEGGWTRIFNHLENSGRDRTTAMFYKVADSEPSSYTFDTSISNNEELSCMIHTYRGVDTSNVLDVTFDDTEDSGHLATDNNDVTPPNRPVTTATDEAWVVVWHFGTHDDITSVGAPSNYTLRDSLTGGSMDHRQQILADREISTATTESPGDWTHSCSTCNQQEYTVATIALRPFVDSTAPADVSDLATSNPQTDSIDIGWTAPGDDGSTGTATSYDVRYSTSTITDVNWGSATQATGEPTPSAAGSSESMTVSDLSEETTYYFGIKTSDEVPNESGLSNIPTGATDSSATPTPSPTPSPTPTPSPAPDPGDDVTVEEVDLGANAGVRPAEIFFSGEMYSGVVVTINLMDEYFGDVLEKGSEYTIGETGAFNVDTKGNFTGSQFYGLFFKDADGKPITSKFYTYILEFNTIVTQANIILPPTVELNKTTFSKSEDIVATGLGAPGNTIEMVSNEKVLGSSTVLDNGSYSVAVAADSLFLGPHKIQMRQVDDETGKIGDTSDIKSLTIGQFSFASVDLNADDKIDIADWSIFLFNWSSPDAEVKLRDDLNNDGVVDVSDFSVFLTSFQSSTL